MAKEKVLIVGGGFGGVKAALSLADDPRFAVTLLSIDSDLRYYPTLYRTATGGTRANSSIPLAEIFAGKPIRLVRGRAVKLDRKAKQIITGGHEKYDYDTLIIGLGVVTNYFGIPGLADYSYSIKSQRDVHRFKRHLHNQISTTGQLDEHYVIVGAGPTGIELAGALPGYLRYIMRNHGLKNEKVQIDLIEAAPRLLPRLPKKASKTIKRRLQRLGVKVHTKSAVQGQSIDGLTINGKPLRSQTVVWTAGVTNHPFFKDNEFVMMGRGKVGVDTYLQAEENIFVIGDNANTPYSGLAQTALHDGAFVAQNLRRRASHKDMRSYTAKRPITVIPAGPYWAAVMWGTFSFYGRLGWLIREAADLIGFHDLQPWPKATEQFLTEFDPQDNCSVCTAARKKK